MAQRMVASFRRSLSFPNPPSCSSNFNSSSSSSSFSKPSKKTYHIRSVSLPCRSSHPLISHLRDQINYLKCWSSSSQNNVVWLCDGLTRLKAVQETVDDLLNLSQTLESLRNHRGLIEKFLNDFLGFLDAYGIFQTLILTLKEHHSTAQAALKRKDFLKMGMCSKNVKKMGKELARLASSLPSIKKLEDEQINDSEEIVRVIRDVIEVTCLVSFALFNGLSVSLSSRDRKLVCFPQMIGMRYSSHAIVRGIQELEEIRPGNMIGKKHEEGEDMRLKSKKMHEAEDCINGIEFGSEKVFRSLFNTRVSLLNVLTAL